MATMDRAVFPEPQISAIVQLKSGTDAKSLLENIDNVTVQSAFDNFAIVTCPVLATKEIEKLPEVVQIEFNVQSKPDLNFARPVGKVSAAQTGFTYNDHNYKLDGTGVVVGMMDTGLDANHINFKNDDGTSRIKRLWHMNSSDGSSVAYTDETINRFSTDNSSESHATHVLGIAGGSYKGPATYNLMNAGDGSSITKYTDAACPYYGVATGADLAASVGTLYTPNIVQGVQNIIEYAESQSKPVVVNLSLGHTTGPHDGTDAYSQALSKLGDRGIICMSAGNDGDLNIALSKKFTSSSGNNSMLRTFPYTKNSSGTEVNGTANGTVEVWSLDNSALTVKIMLRSTNKIETPLLTVDGTTTQASTTGVSDFTTNFNGSISIVSGVQSYNNRFAAQISFNNVSKKSSNTTQDLYILVQGTSGQAAYLYSSGSIEFGKSTFGSSPTGWTAGSANGSINDACAAKNILSVGASVSRTKWSPVGTSLIYNFAASQGNIGEIAVFSSYGTPPAGYWKDTTLPRIVGPGSTLVSSYSRYYVNSQNVATSIVAQAKSGTDTYSWGQMQGTSMSCPFVTGTIGLWLQVEPTLNFSQIMEVLENSADNSMLESASSSVKRRWGLGQIDAVEGAKYIIDNLSAIGEVWADEEQRLVVVDGGATLDVTMGGAATLTVRLYDMQGRQVRSARSEGANCQLDAAGLSRGVYILEATDQAGTRLTRKIAR